MRLCLIGCGDIANAAHGPALARLQREGLVELVGCCGRRLERAEAFAARFDFESAWCDYRRMLEELHPDAVMLMLPVQLTAEAAVEVMERGYPVIMEKPPGMNLEEVDRLAAVSRKRGLFNAVMFNRRSMPLLQQLKKQLPGYAVEAVSLEMCRYNRVGGEDFTTTIIHSIDCVSFLIGQPYAELQCCYDEHPSDGYTNYYISGRLKNGVHVDMRFLPAAGGVTERLAVYARDAQFYLDLPVWSGTDYTEGVDCPGHLLGVKAQERFLELDGETLSGCRDGFVLNGFYEEDKNLLCTCRDGLSTPHEIASGRQSVEIMLGLRERRQTMRWEEQT